MSIIVVNNKEEVITTLCELIETTARRSIDENGIFKIGVSGMTIVLMYSMQNYYFKYM